MEYVDAETFNRFFYRNELVLRVAEDIKDTGKVSCNGVFVRHVGLLVS